MRCYRNQAKRDVSDVKDERWGGDWLTTFMRIRQRFGNISLKYKWNWRTFYEILLPKI